MCLPPIELFRLALSHSIWQIESHENYQKRSYRNRFYIDSTQGKLMCSIPLVKGKNQQQAIRDVKISYHDDWINQLGKTLQSSYGSAPFAEFYLPELLTIFQNKIEYLFDLNWMLLEYILERLSQEITLDETDSYSQHHVQEIHDYRNQFRPNTDNLTSQVVRYQQVHQDNHEFIPNLSILDLLLCYGPESVGILLN